MKKKKSNKQFTLGALLSEMAAGVAAGVPTVVDVSNTINSDVVWNSDTDGDGVIDQIYLVDEAVFVGDIY